LASDPIDEKNKSGKESYYYKLFPLIACEEGCSSGLAQSGVVLGAPKDTLLRPLGTSPYQREEIGNCDFNSQFSMFNWISILHCPFTPQALFSHKTIPLALPAVAVVILNYNGRNHLENFLPSVIASTYANLCVIVADNASTDDSVDFVQNHFPSVKVITHPVNEGFAGGYNWALKKIQSDYYVLLNSDVSVTPGWIEPVIDIMEKDVFISACQPKILSYHHPALPGNCPAAV